MMKILFFLFFVDCYIITQQSPHILQDLQVCEISIPDGKKFKKMKVPSYIIAENPELNVMVSLCGQIPRVFPNDGTCRNSCVYNKRSKSLVTSASSFAVPYIVDDASNLEITLRLENVLKCTKDENYEIMVKMVSNPSLKKPRLNIMDTQCQLEIEMLKPDYQPPCTFLLDTKELIDFRALNRRIISVPWKGETFKIALCGSVRECGLEVAGCKVGNDTLVFGEIKTQQVRYDNINNHLKVVASVGKKLKMEVKVHCNWLVPYFANPKYMEPAQQGRTYKFEVESSFGCVKLPTNCIIHDAKNDMTYNLEGLSNKYGHRVKAVGSKYFLLNICGNLVTRGPQKNECDLEHSQACQVDGTSYINKGSIPSFEVKNKAIKVIVSEGSRCNVNQTYSTEIEVVCSYIEKGPKFILEQNCVVKIMWETPKACPKFEKQSDSCELSTSFGGVNLKSLHGEDRNQNFPSATFKYNLCGNLFSNCSLYSNVTACYVNKNGGKEDVIGWNSPELSYNNGDLQLKYFGDQCPQGKGISSLTINLFCSYVDRETSVTQSNSCTFVKSIYSAAACFSKDYRDCRFEDGDSVYDLRPLIAKEKNYVIQDNGNRNITYLLNVCWPLLNQRGSLISANSMVYKVDKSKPHILDRFISLGKVASPTFEDGRLVINSIFGHNYELGLDYTSKIIFQCSQDEQKPTLLRVNGPSYEFIWRTKSACPKTKFACSIPSGNDTLLVPSRDITIEMNRQNASYSFSLCADNYKLCINDSCINNNFLRQVQQHGGKSHIRLKLNDPTECKNDSVLREINVSLECDPRQQDATVSNLSGSNCQRNLVVRTKIACKNVKTIRTIDENLKITNGSIDKDSYDEAGKNNHSIENNETVLQMDEHHHSDINNKLNKQEDGSKQPTINEDKETIIQSIEGNKNSNASEQNKNVYETVKTTSKESQIAKEKSKENVQNKYKEVEYQKCDSIESENGKFSLKNIEPFSIRSKSSYLINFHGSSPECGGSVCKNGIVILPFVKKCPVVSYEDTYIKLSFSEEGMCPFTGNQKLLTDPHSFLIQILLKCNESSHFGSLLEEDTCKVSFDYYSQEICDMVARKSSSSVYAIITGVSFILIALSVLAYVIYQRNCCKKLSYASVGRDDFVNHSKLL